jgi:hypothetical protein
MALMNETPLTPMPWRQRLLFAAVLAAIAAALFHQSFKPEMVLFSSDGPLGMIAGRQFALPEGFSGMWSDSNWLGTSMGTPAPSYTFILYWLLGPLGTAKFLAPLSVFALGLAATFCFRVFGCRPMICLLAGIAAELNSNFFSNACWGVGTRCTALAAAFLALAAIWSSRSGPLHVRLVKLILAGLATGLSVMEGADNGMIFSLFIAAFAFYVPLIGEGSPAKKILQSGAATAVVTIFAVFIAYQTVQSLVGTQIKGIVGMEQTAESKERRWVGATLWSLPKIEILRVIIPGVFGYRQDTPGGGEYWGGVGSDPGIAEMQKLLKSGDPQKQQEALGYLQNAQWRSSGAGEYAGILVVLIAAWAVARSFSRQAQTYSATEKKLIWFWAAMCFVGVIMAWGRHAPFYQLFYALPYMSTIRNPMKFMHPAHMTLMILFAYGLQGLWREYLEKTSATAAKIPWDKFWKYACFAIVALAAVGWLVYAAQKPSTSGNETDLVRYMKANAIGGASSAEEVARFSIREVGIFVLVLGLSVAAVLAIQAGKFRGPRAIGAGVLLGAILVLDLARANSPWIQYFDYQARYATNPVFDLLKEKSWEHRVTAPPFRLNEAYANFQNVYRGEWMQHQFQFFNIQMLDVVHEGGRSNIEKETYVKQFNANIARYWQLTNTRFIFGVPGLVEALNRDLDPVQRSFQQRLAFSLYRKPGATAISVETNAAGPFALVEYTGALPRAKLYSQWQVNTNDLAALGTLGSTNFQPDAEVILAEEIPASTATAGTPGGTAEYTGYDPKKFTIKTSSPAPGVLLVNDRHHPDWKVTIDGQPAKLLRANFIMRAVQVPAGQHEVVWRYQPSLKAFYISMSAILLGALLCISLPFLTRVPATDARRK